MTTHSRWTLIGVIGAVVSARGLVGELFSLLWFIAKLAIVVVVAVIVYLVLRGMFRSDAE